MTNATQELRPRLVPSEGAMSPPTAGMLQQQISDLDEKHEEGHARLRKDLDALTDKVSDLTMAVEAHRQEVRNYRAAPTNITSVVFSANQVAAILISFLIAAGACYAVIESVAKVSDAVERLDKKSELLRIQYESLMKIVLSQGTKREER